ncbi:MAG: hypothetical protein R3E12_10705 [Candidatus Eisenbacteria bacterium]
MRRSLRHVLAHRPVAAVALAAIAVFTLSGCLEAPELEDRWTRLDVVSLTTEANAPTKWGEPVTLHARGRITYRAVLTGAVAMGLKTPSIYPDLSMRRCWKTTSIGWP